MVFSPSTIPACRKSLECPNPETWTGGPYSLSRGHASYSVPSSGEELSMSIRLCKKTILLMALVVGGMIVLTPRISASGGDNVLDDQLSVVLSRHGFTGAVGSS